MDRLGFRSSVLMVFMAFLVFFFISRSSNLVFSFELERGFDAHLSELSPCSA